MNKVSRFGDAWIRTLKEIVDLGPDAVPELIEELDATNNDWMIRCLGFTLRGIGDKRAVPGLIRAIPKTLRKPGSDMGLQANDAELLRFVRQHELEGINKAKVFGFGRPVREVCGALEKLTTKRFNEHALYHVFLGTAVAEHRKARQQYYDVARTWADWWEKNWGDFVDDRAYRLVNLPQIDLVSLGPDVYVETISEKKGLILQSVLDPKSTRAFYDIENDRFADLPEKWRLSGKIESSLDEILEWAREQGFDLMGTEYRSSDRPEPVFALQGIGLRAWEQDIKRWKQGRDVVLLQEVRKEGRAIAGLLLRRDPVRVLEIIEPEAIASYLVTTAERTPAFVHVGAEVRSDQQRPGEFFKGDPDMNPVGPFKGRRFVLMFFGECDEQPRRPAQ